MTAHLFCPPVRSSIHPSVARLRPSWHRCSFNSAPFSPSLSRSVLAGRLFVSRWSSLSRSRALEILEGPRPPPRSLRSATERACEKEEDARCAGENDGSATSYEATALDEWTDKLASGWQCASSVLVCIARARRALRRGSIERSMCAQAVYGGIMYGEGGDICPERDSPRETVLFVIVARPLRAINS